MSFPSSAALWLAAAAITVGAAACGYSSTASDAAFGGDSTGGGGNGVADSGATFATPGTDDAGAAGSAKQGNLLCNATYADCKPDGEDAVASGCGDPTGGSGGGAEDAGPFADSDASTLACHVVVTDEGDGGLAKAPTCAESGGGKNDAPCQGSADCASGFECVTPGVCRKYCCDDDCKDATFCDIQSEMPNTDVKVPVCEPVHTCSLLATTNTCGTGATCTVVDDQGTTSCEAIGPAKVGESCDTVHCGANLVCLGDLNARKCFALCNKTSSTCDSPLTCTGSAPLFRDMDIGVCQ